jgi:hypothetical protein
MPETEPAHLSSGTPQLLKGAFVMSKKKENVYVEPWKVAELNQIAEAMRRDHPSLTVPPWAWRRVDGGYEARSSDGSIVFVPRPAA